MSPKARVAVIGLWAALLLLGLWWVTARTTVATDLTAFLPKAHTEAERLLVDELRAGPAARIILIAIADAEPEQLAAVSQAMATQLRTDPAFARVANGAGLLSDAERALLFTHRYLLSPTVSAQRFDAAALTRSLQQRLRELASPLGAVEKQTLPADPTAEFRSLLQAWQDPRAPSRRHGVWFDRDGRRALLLVQTRASAYQLDDQARALAHIRGAFEQARGATGARLQMAGPGLYAVASRDATRQETQWLSVAASLAVALILALVYRRAAVLVLGALPLLSGILAATAVVSVWYGGIHGLTLAFGTTLLGIAIDYPIHVFSHMGRGRSLGAALTDVWPTLRLGAVTTALGFGALIGAGFAGLAQLGVFAVTGLLAAAAVTRWGLPALVSGRWRLAAAGGGRALAWVERARGRLKPWPAAVLAAALALWLVWGAFPWQDDLAAMSPIPERTRALDAQLRQALGAPEVSHAVLIRAADPQAALQHTEQVARDLQRLVEQQALTGFTPASRFLPSAETQRQRQQHLPPPDRLQADLAQATKALPFRPDAFAPFVQDMAEARQQAPLLLNDLADTTLGTRLQSLLFAGPDGWLSVIPLNGVRDPQALAQWAQQAGPEVHYLNQRATARELMRRFRHEGLSRALWSGVIIVIVLALALRSAAGLARVLFPMALAALSDLALLVAAGERISLFHLVALLMVLGAGVDYSLFFNRPESDPGAARRTLHALLVCAFSTVTVFGILAGSELPVLRAIGATVAIGVSASLLFAMLMARPAPAAVAP